VPPSNVWFRQQLNCIVHGDVFEVGFGDCMHSLDQPGVHRSVAVAACVSTLNMMGSQLSIGKLRWRSSYRCLIPKIKHVLIQLKSNSTHILMPQELFLFGSLPQVLSSSDSLPQVISSLFCSFLLVLPFLR
jgi:hypothetical protein